MLKKTVVLSLILCIWSAIPTYAGQWRLDERGWWWENDDGSYPKAQWQWLDGNCDGTSECYYFDGTGYLITDTVAPDGYRVNSDGAWVLNGIVQVKVDGSNGINDWNGDWEIIGQVIIPDQGENRAEKQRDGVYADDLIDIDPYELAYRVIELVNEERVARGKHPLEINDELMENAMVRAEEASEYFSHTRPDGRNCGTAITVRYSLAAENLHGGGRLSRDTLEVMADETLEGWIHSAGHKKNMLDSRFRETGVGVYITDQSYTVSQYYIK